MEDVFMESCNKDVIGQRSFLFHLLYFFIGCNLVFIFALLQQDTRLNDVEQLADDTRSIQIQRKPVIDYFQDNLSVLPEMQFKPLIYKATVIRNDRAVMI